MDVVLRLKKRTYKRKGKGIMVKKKMLVISVLMLGLIMSGCGNGNDKTTTEKVTEITTEESGTTAEASTESTTEKNAESTTEASGSNDNSASQSGKGGNDRALSFDQAADMLMKNDYMESFSTSGLSMIDEGTEEVEEKICRLVGIGKDSGGKFTTEYHFAVSRDQTVYQMDFMSGDWAKLSSDVEFAKAGGSSDAGSTSNSDGKDNKDSKSDSGNTADNKDKSNDSDSDNNKADNSDTSSSSGLAPEVQYEANIFLSNFAETNLYYCYNVNTSLNDMVGFIHIYAKINARNRLSYEDGYEVLECDWVVDNLRRFYGYSISASDLENSYENNEESFCSDGKVYFPAADGDSYNYIAVVDKLDGTENGDCLVKFTVYSVDINEYFEKGIDESYYHLTPEEAAANPSLKEEVKGEATMAPTEFNGHHTFMLGDYAIIDSN